VREAYRDILSHFKDRRVIGISVQKMAPQGIEAIIGVTHDKNFGPVIMFGLGGIFTEVLRDVAFRVLPISEDTAAEMIEEIKGYPLLKGYRGQSADIRAVRELLVKVSDLMLIHPEIGNWILILSFFILQVIWPLMQGYSLMKLMVILKKKPLRQKTTFSNCSILKA
jgi:acyl-CoA synthetase (NDP forming)